MKIIDVKVTVWKWDNIPPTQYTKDFKSLDSRSTNMALVQILTDENITGYGLNKGEFNPETGSSSFEFTLKYTK